MSAITEAADQSAVGPPRAHTATQTVYCPRPPTVESRAAALHEAMHVIHADELAELPAWRRELATSRYALRYWHDRNWPDFDRTARNLAISLKTYTDAEQVRGRVIQRHVPRALDAEAYR
jgi:hypothetical protein